MRLGWWGRGEGEGEEWKHWEEEESVPCLQHRQQQRELHTSFLPVHRWSATLAVSAVAFFNIKFSWYTSMKF